MITTTIEHIFKDAFIKPDKEEIESLGTFATYIAIRPTFEYGDFTVSALITDAEECHVQLGWPKRPSFAMAIFKGVVPATEAAAALKAKYPHLLVWLNSQETQVELDCSHSIWPRKLVARSTAPQGFCRSSMFVLPNSCNSVATPWPAFRRTARPGSRGRRRYRGRLQNQVHAR